MKIRFRTGASAAVVLALVAGTGGVAVAAGELDWYDGGKATVADPDRVTTIKIVDAGGTEVTSGSIGDPLGAFAVAAGAVRNNDTSASLFVHQPSPGTAQGAWSGQQTSGTTKFSGPGAASGPSGVGSNPFVSLSNSLPLAHSAEVYKNTSTAPSFAGVYELRLRTSSATKGISNAYGSTYVKVTGQSWAVTAAPDLGEVVTPPTVPAATVRPAWGANFAYGASRNVSVAVTGGRSTAKGNVKLLSGSRTLAAAKTLDASGKATLTIAKGALLPGTRKVKVVFTSTNAAVVKSASSAERTYVVAKGKAAAPTWKVTKKVTAKKAGALAVSVAKPAGLVQPRGKVTVTLKLGKKKTVIRNKALSTAGKVTVKVPKRKAGKWKVTIAYLGDSVYAPRTSAAKNLAVKKPARQNR